MSGPPTGQDALERLERRIADLEQTVGALVALTGLRGAPIAPRRLASPAPVSAAPPGAASGARAGEPSVSTPPGRPFPLERPGFDLEQWVGGRGLLLVGVVALLVAGGLFLKYAFDRGWIAPGLRVLGAVVAGVGVAAFGERQVGAGLRRFGLALVGAGGGLVYLGLWAAAGPYQLSSRQVGVALIAVLTALVAWRAARHEAEPLALWALLGAFAAPVLLPAPEARPETFLAYLAVVSFAAAALASRYGWRLVLDFALLGYLSLAAILVSHTLSTPLGFAYIAAGGIAVLLVTWTRAWPETRLAGLGFTWLLLFPHATDAGTAGARWAAAAAAAVLLLATWWRQRALARFQAVDWQRKLRLKLDDEVLVFVVTPLAFLIAIAIVERGFLKDHPGTVPAAAAVLYIATGWRGRWAPFVSMGSALTAIAIAAELSDSAVILSWSALVLVLVAADRGFGQRGAAPIALLVAAIALVGLLDLVSARSEHPFARPASLALYGYLAATAAGAWLWHKDAAGPTWAAHGAGFLWGLCGTALFAGVSFELSHFFQNRRSSWQGAALAGDLALSVWWLVNAGALVRLGFWRDSGLVRYAGLAVAILAALKIAIHDLSRLEALYRVGSVFVLALIALAVAYAYNQRSRAVEAGATHSP